MSVNIPYKDLTARNALSDSHSTYLGCVSNPLLCFGFIRDSTLLIDFYPIGSIIMVHLPHLPNKFNQMHLNIPVLMGIIKGNHHYETVETHHFCLFAVSLYYLPWEITNTLPPIIMEVENGSLQY